MELPSKPGGGSASHPSAGRMGVAQRPARGRTMRPGDALPHQGKSAEHYKGVGPCPGATIDDEETRVPSAPGRRGGRTHYEEADRKEAQDHPRHVDRGHAHLGPRRWPQRRWRGGTLASQDKDDKDPSTPLVVGQRAAGSRETTPSRRCMLDTWCCLPRSSFATQGGEKSSIGGEGRGSLSSLCMLFKLNKIRHA
jgi:hypothetical protein